MVSPHTTDFLIGRELTLLSPIQPKYFRLSVEARSLLLLLSHILKHSSIWSGQALSYITMYLISLCLLFIWNTSKCFWVIFPVALPINFFSTRCCALCRKCLKLWKLWNNTICVSRSVGILAVMHQRIVQSNNLCPICLFSF
jgi:hypothetical protein